MTDTPRLIEHAFPLKQASLDSVHEKNVRHGHISTLHIWPARRPLAACRAALIATLLPDPSASPKPEGMSDEEWHSEIARRRQELCEKIGGKVVKKTERKKMPNGQVVEREKEVTEGGILHWGRETENKADLEWFRQEIRKAYGGRAPKVLDPFAGGGAIPLEAMRLGCEATAVDINPVAWFILKCTLEYPQKLAGKTHPLPDFILQDEEFMDAFRKAHRLPEPGGLFEAETGGQEQADAETRGQQQTDAETRRRGDTGKAESPRHQLAASPRPAPPAADLAWHVRAWGRWVLDRARRELGKFYPTYADFEPLNKRDPKPYEKRPMQLVPLKDDGTPDIGALNAEFSKQYLADQRNPRWVAKPTVAYLWARTVKCKNCRATIPLLKTRWLCKKDRKRVLLTMDVVQNDAETRGHGDAGSEGRGDTETRGRRNAGPVAASPLHRVPASVRFGIEANVPTKGANNAAKREHDRRVGAGTMSRAGAKCPCCGTIITMEDIRLEGKAGRLAPINTAVVVDSQGGKEYRLPTEYEIRMAAEAERSLPEVFAQIPFGLPEESTPKGSSRKGGGSAFTVHIYGLDRWRKLFTPRQLLVLGTFVKWTRGAKGEQTRQQYPEEWTEAICSELAVCLDKLVDRQSTLCRWDMGYSKVNSTFTRFALPILWDFCQGNPLSATTGNYSSCVEWVAETVEHVSRASTDSPQLAVHWSSGISFIARHEGVFDAVVTDPPYYDAIPYSDLMDFFYIWLRRTLFALTEDVDEALVAPLAPKWNHEKNDGELIDDASRHEGDRARSKAVYEDGMARVFQGCGRALKPDGKMVVVFANKQPDAWETLVSALIRSGFVVDGSWPIQTEMENRSRSHGSAALASSVWLVCKRRLATAKPGWDNQVLDDMHQNIRDRLREFWDAGIRGPDFVWAATGPALEAYSKHPVVKKANEPGAMTVSEFLTHVRRIVVDFVVGRVLSGDKEGDADTAAGDRLDEPTAYYLLHRHDFGMEDAPAGACILYAISCGISDRELSDTWDLIAFTKGKRADEDEAETGGRGDAEMADEAGDPDAEEDSGSKVKLKTWAQRKRASLGYEAPGGKPVPLIDRVHCLMHLWKAGNLAKVDAYLDDHGLRGQELFKRLLQSLIELSPQQSEERSLLESLSNHIQAKGVVVEQTQRELRLRGRQQ